MLTFTAEALTDATTRIFRAAGTPDDIAEFQARALVGANLAGHDSHGVIHVPGYVAMIREGVIKPAVRPEVAGDGPSIIQVDGGWGFGHFASHVCMDLACRRAREQQLALVTLTRANHIGRLGQWAEEAAAAGMIGMAMTSWGNGPYAATPYGGAGKVLSTNPIAWGVPRADGSPFVLDFATSAVAEGKIRVARSKGAAVPNGWITDADGNPTTDPNDFYNGGMLLPFGGHKGFALSILSEILSVCLTGADAARGPRDFENGAVFLAIDPSGVRPMADFTASIEKIAARVKSVPAAPGSSGVLFPGEPESTYRASRSVEGIQIAESTWDDIRDAAKSVGADVGGVLPSD
jgi:LDH2 family malate/lactate/ureidoglycolate dehydrogenase